MKKIALYICLIFTFSIFFNGISIKNEGITALKMLVTSKTPTEAAASNGSIEVKAEGGKGPYKLIVHTNTRTESLMYEGVSFSLKNLPKGFYMLNLIDSEGTAVSETINL